jgi:hypothetical protein
MKYKSAPDFRQAPERRLPALSEETGRSPLRLRKEIAFDRLLARLVATAPAATAIERPARTSRISSTWP